MALLLHLASFLFVSNVSNAEFVTKKITLGSKTVQVEVADTNAKREKGLMFRKSLPENSGMLFVFENEDYRSFWMKNTFIDLSIGYFDKNYILLEVIEMQGIKSEMETPKVYPSKHKAQYALEMNKQWFKKHKVKPGDKFKFTDSK